MLRFAPFAGSFPIIQPFGVNPQAHAAIVCAGTPLRGHDGIDFALPAGTPVLAVQEGSVVAAGQSLRVGRFVLLDHGWGQSLYAHLSTVAVRTGEAVKAGTSVGASGVDAANGTAHLHFALRIAPYSLNDGWCGYSDPQPYLDRLTLPRGAIIGPHILGGVHRHLPLLERWQPRLILVVDPNPDEMRDLRRLCPQSTIVGRIFAPDNEVNDRIRANPAEGAAWAHGRVLERLTPHIDYWQVANEVLQGPDGLPALNEFEVRRMTLAEGSGYRCAILAFSVGNPDLPEHDRLAAWRMVYPALERAERNGHCVSVHQYAAPDLTKPTLDWHIHRLEHQVLRRLPFKKLQFAVTEYGVDGLLLGPDPRGWSQFLPAQEYVSQLLRAGRYLERFSGRVLGYCVYSLGVTGPWGSYDIDGEVASKMAESAERGTWGQVRVEGGGLDAAESDRATGPGGEPAGAPPPVDKPQPVDPPQPAKPAKPTEPAKPAKPAEPAVRPAAAPEQRISEWVTRLNMRIRPIAERPDRPAAEDGIVYVIKDVFTTLNGSWEPNGQPGSIPQWARDSYLSSDFLEAGADHHLFAALLDTNGHLLRDHEIRYWSDGFDRLGDPAYDGYVEERTKQQSGWANLVIFSGSSFVPERGESGPWCWTPSGRADVMTGGGLPANNHISTFVVWQAMRDAPVEPPVEPPVDPPPPPPPPPPTEVERKLGSWIDDLRLSIKTLADRPDNPPGTTAYVIKQVFTTRDGSWEPSATLGSVDGWARDLYLKPWGAPDYFDDAGADHHLFAAIIGPDGALVRDAEILYWSDGFGQLGNPAYTGYISRLTKTQSGWANIPMDGGASYVPERGEQGPWCWAPRGASEVIVGGGMPAKQHVSIFVVWQAVTRTVPPPVDPGDHQIFLPWVGGPSQELPIPLPPEFEQSDALDAQALFTLRADAWLRVGIESGHDTPFAEYARRAGLGLPVTHQFESGGVRAQGFAGGIVFARLDAPELLRHVAW